MVFGLVIEFIDLLQNVSKSNYSAIANSHNLQFITACTKSFSMSSLHWSLSGNGFKAVDYSTSIFTSLLAGECLTTN
jgi:hypothetical protein